MSHATILRVHQRLHPLQAMLVGSPVPLFMGALLSDFAYRGSFQMQWANFASWLIAGALVLGGIAVLWALVDLVRAPSALRRRRALHLVLLLAMCAVGLVNALVHAKDAWAIMPDALYLSAVTVALALAAAWTGLSRNDQVEL